jgi:hypothetical protein
MDKKGSHMSTELRPPIILFGNTRSGTSMVQNVLSVHPDVVKWYEPRTLWLCADPARSHDEFDESDATEKVKRYIRDRFLKYQKQHGNRIVMEKTPANIFKIPFVHEIFPEATFMYIIRNPFSFISSVELKWQRSATKKGIGRRLRCTPVSQLHHHAARLFIQQFNKRILRRKYLIVWGPRYNGIDEDFRTLDILTVIARQWAIGSRKAEEALARVFKGPILRIKYEEFVENPIYDMERICAHCGLDLTDEMIRAATEWVKSDRQFKWRRFDPRDLARLVPEMSQEMHRHGYEIPEEIARYVENLPGNENKGMALKRKNRPAINIDLALHSSRKVKRVQRTF